MACLHGIRSHGIDIYLGMSPVQNGGSYVFVLAEIKGNGHHVFYLLSIPLISFPFSLKIFNNTTVCIDKKAFKGLHVGKCMHASRSLMLDDWQLRHISIHHK